MSSLHCKESWVLNQTQEDKIQDNISPHPQISIFFNDILNVPQQRSEKSPRYFTEAAAAAESDFLTARVSYPVGQILMMSSRLKMFPQLMAELQSGCITGTTEFQAQFLGAAVRTQAWTIDVLVKEAGISASADPLLNRSNTKAVTDNYTDKMIPVKASVVIVNENSNWLQILVT